MKFSAIFQLFFPVLTRRGMNIIIAVYVTGTGPLPEGSQALEKVGPHSCSTSRSDSPLESTERKKKQKRKDKEKKEKV